MTITKQTIRPVPTGMPLAASRTYSGTVSQLIKNLQFFINELVEFFSVNGILSSYFSIKVLHLRDLFQQFSLSGSQSCAAMVKRVKIDPHAVGPGILRANMALLTLLGSLKTILVEIVSCFEHVNLKTYMANQSQYRKLLKASRGHNVGSVTENVHEYVASLFRKEFLDKNIQCIDALMHEFERINQLILTDALSRIDLLDKKLVEFNFANSFAIYEFEQLENPGETDLQLFVQEREKKMAVLHSLRLFNVT